MEPITLIWVSLEWLFPPAKHFRQRRWRQKWNKSQRSRRPVIGGTGVNGLLLPVKKLFCLLLLIDLPPCRLPQIFKPCLYKTTWNPFSKVLLTLASMTRLYSIFIYYPTALRRAQITPKTNANITRYLYFRGPVTKVCLLLTNQLAGFPAPILFRFAYFYHAFPVNKYPRNSPART